MDGEVLPEVTCSGCGRTGKVVRFSREEEVAVRGLRFSVTKVLRRCEGCGGEFENSRDPDWRVDAYNQYRTAKGMVAPEAIRDWRDHYGLKQADVTGLLGWGEVTLGRYEKGSLASEAHNRALAELMKPERLAEALAAKPDAVPPERRAAALQRLREEKGLLPPEDLRVIRVKYRLDTTAMATLLSVSEATWEAWERGDGAPSGSAGAFLRVIARRPDVVRDLLSELGLLTGTSRDVLDRVEADTNQRVAAETGVPLDEVQRVEEGYRRALPEVAERMADAA